MPRPDPFLDALIPLFSPLGEIHWRKMFGGAGVYCDGRMFILVADDRLYFKADSVNVEWYEQKGSEPFIFDDGAKPIAMSYWLAPASVIADSELALEWGEQGVSAAMRAATKPKSRAKKRE